MADHVGRELLQRGPHPRELLGDTLHVLAELGVERSQEDVEALLLNPGRAERRFLGAAGKVVVLADSLSLLSKYAGKEKAPGGALF